MSDSSDTGRRKRDAGLTERQRTILDVIRASVSSRGYPPSIREIGDAVGLTSTSSVAHQLRTLERKGYLRRDPNRPRAVDVRGADDAVTPIVKTDVAGSDALPEPTFVPVLGRIADRPVVRDGEIVVRPVGYVALTFDHRVVDGARAAEFGLAVLRRLEEPADS